MRMFTGLKAKSILDFSSHLTNALLQSQPLPDITLYLNALPLAPAETSSQVRSLLNQTGVSLWNLCNEKKSLQPLNSAKARAFAFGLLESARHRSKCGGKEPRLIRNGIKVVKECVSLGEFELSSDILERIARHVESFATRDVDDHPSQSENQNQFLAEYVLLRLTCAWKQDRLDLAEHFWAKLSGVKDRDQIGEKVIDLLYEIGKDQLEKKNVDLAVRWLGRANQVLKESDLTLLGPDVAELRLNVLHTYVRSLIASQSADAGVTAHQVMGDVRQEYGQKLAVLLLDLEILSYGPDADAGAIFVQLSALTRSIHLIESNYTIIFHYIHHLKSLNAELACKALGQFLTQRLVQHGNVHWIESAIISLLWMSTTKTGVANDPPALESWLTDISKAWGRGLGVEAIHGAFALIWKNIERATASNASSGAIFWCRLVLRPIFGEAGEENIGKVQRKLAHCYLHQGDVKAGREVLDGMSNATKAHPLSLYLAYSIAIRSRDDNVQRQLHHLAMVCGRGSELLFAAVSETMRFGSKRQGILLLQRILDKYNYEPSPEIDICAFLRCTARLLISVLDEESTVDEEMLSRLCHIFKAGAVYTMKCNDTSTTVNSMCPVLECEWFSRTGYNLALRKHRAWPVRYVVDLLQYSSEVRYPTEPFPDQENIQSSLQIRRATQFVVQVKLYCTQARLVTPSWSLDDIPRTAYDSKSPPLIGQLGLALYNRALQLVREFETSSAQVRRLVPLISEQVVAYMCNMEVSLLPLAFEAGLYLWTSSTNDKQHSEELDYLENIIKRAQKTSPKDVNLFVDMVLAASSVKTGMSGISSPTLPVEAALSLLDRLISGIKSDLAYDVVKASKWIRCIVQLVLERSQLSVQANVGEQMTANLPLLIGIVSQAALMARSSLDGNVVAENHAHNVESSHVYPREEVEWLATTLFNAAIDLYIEGDEVSAKTCAEKAIELADVLCCMDLRGSEGVACGDGGVLVDTLKQKMAQLSWS